MSRYEDGLDEGDEGCLTCAAYLFIILLTGAVLLSVCERLPQ